MVRLLPAIPVALAFAAIDGEAKTLRSEPAVADGVSIALSADLPDAGLFVQEMAIVSITATFRDPLNLVRIDTSIWPNARAIQLGKDAWTLEGVSSRTLVRRIAVFPQKSGALSIGPFRMDATLTTAGGGRREASLETPPFGFAVAAAPQQSGAWWLPVRRLTVKDDWSPDPQDVPADGLAHRTVTVEALGALGETLPPAPLLRSPPIVTFALPETRETVVTPDGPLARAVYRWDVRAAHDEPTLLAGVTIPWFDTTSRSMEEAFIPERRVAERLLLLKERTDPWSRFVGALDARAFALGLGLGLAILAALALGAWSDPHRAVLSGLARAARRGDAAAVRAAVTELTRQGLDRAIPHEALQQAALLDRHLHARTATPCPDLRRLAKQIRRAVRRSGCKSDPSTRLLPLEPGAP